LVVRAWLQDVSLAACLLEEERRAIQVAARPCGFDEHDREDNGTEGEEAAGHQGSPGVSGQSPVCGAEGGWAGVRVQASMAARAAACSASFFERPPPCASARPNASTSTMNSRR